MIAETLLEHGIRLRSYREGDHKTTCPKCSPHRRKKSDPCLSVTIDAEGGAVWNCHHCGWRDNIPGQERRMEPRRYRKPKLPEKRDTGDKMLAWFADRGISSGTVNRAGCFLTTRSFGGEKQGCIAFPYTLDGELVNIKYRTRDKRFAQESDAQRTLYGIDEVKGAELVFVEGEMDVLACWEAGIENVVTLPDGAPRDAGKGDKRYEAIANCADKLEGMERVIIATDMDGPGNVLAEELAARFGRDRCFRVRFPEINDAPCKDANDTLLACGSKVLHECIANAEPWPISGICRVRDVEGRLRDLYHGNRIAPLTVGYSEFDKLYKVLPGQFIVVTGIPNHGKSQFVDQIAVNLAEKHGWRFGVFSPEHSTELHVTRLVEKRQRAPFWEGPTPRMSEYEMSEASAWVDDYFAFIEPEEDIPTIDWILERARVLVLRHGVKGLILDPYNEIEASRDFRQTETEFISQMISKLKRFAKVHDVAVWMVVHPTKLQRQADGKEPVPGLYDLSGSAHWRNKADMGLVVYRDFDAEKTRVFVKKVREQPYCGEIGEATFRFDTVKRSYYEIPTDEMWAEAEQAR